MAVRHFHMCFQLKLEILYYDLIDSGQKVKRANSIATLMAMVDIVVYLARIILTSLFK